MRLDLYSSPPGPAPGLSSPRCAGQSQALETVAVPHIHELGGRACSGPAPSRAWALGTGTRGVRSSQPVSGGRGRFAAGRSGPTSACPPPGLWRRTKGLWRMLPEHLLGTFWGWLKPPVLRCSSNYRLTNLT